MKSLRKQKRLRALLLIAALNTSVLPINTALSETTECTPIVKACDRALADQDKVIDLKTRQIKVQEEIISAQDVRIMKLEKDKDSLFSNPWFYFGVGVVTGAVLLRK